jgi:hypothetical protein
MPEVDALDFYDEVVGNDTPHAQGGSVEYTLSASSGHEFTLELQELDRKVVIDKLSELPDEMIDMFDGAETAEEAQQRAENQNALTGLSGDAIRAFEEICALSMTHEQLTEHHLKDMAEELELETLFEMGSEIIEISLENDGRIEGFRKQD